ncbi:hypothetical protein [Evansella cellulosilytica]|uniref:Uncharacterized protein n=1 Tax=Evansella cellulosilytica (strain ATCC 21833 / DSM 2522 / FERM P-1141 / JCM 9156 / N-4) TaxID=649639 RepID=E6TT04_EVAC2|nr:hypothetical protein [Evansella cellulosilytica]ADU31912.1 hypothetical protein Bcell_3671 [Evansella cellulosilytica DSM 2522]
MLFSKIKNHFTRLGLKNLIHIAKFSFISIVIIGFISFIASMFINTFVQSILADHFGMFSEYVSTVNIVTFYDILMLSHLTALDFVFHILTNMFFLSSNGGLLLFIIIPALPIFICGYMLHRSTDKTPLDRMISVITFAVFYTITLCVISIFANSDIALSIPSDSMGGIVSLDKNYALWKTAVNGFFISSLFCSFGSFTEYTVRHLHNKTKTIQQPVYIAFISTFIGILILSCISFITISISDDFSDDTLQTKALLTSQFSNYYWGISQLGTLQFELNMYNPEVYEEELTVSYSIVEGVNASEDQRGYEAIIASLFGNYIYLSVFVPILLHLLAGWLGGYSSIKHHTNFLHWIILYSVTIGAFHFIFAHLSSLTFHTNFSDYIYVHLGFSATSLFFTSTALALLFGTVGYFAHRFYYIKEG